MCVSRLSHLLWNEWGAFWSGAVTFFRMEEQLLSHHTGSCAFRKSVSQVYRETQPHNNGQKDWGHWFR